MVSLREWISGLQSSILERCDVMEDMIQPSHLPRQTRLEIYQNAYLLRLAEALQSNYPSLYAVLGENDFGRMMLAYLDAEDPSSASIRWFGSNLCGFLESQSPYQLVPVFSEMARFEWVLRHTVDAADAKRYSFDELKHLDAEAWMALRIGLHPSVSLLSQHWNATAIVQAVSQNLPIPDPEPQSCHWLVYRDIDGAGSWRSISTAEWAALGSISGGASFSDLCEFIAQFETDKTVVAQSAANYMRQWVTEGLLISS